MHAIFNLQRVVQNVTRFDKTLRKEFKKKIAIAMQITNMTFELRCSKFESACMHSFEGMNGFVRLRWNY